MTKEQRNAISNLKEITELLEDEINKNDKNVTAILDITDLKSIKTILYMLEEQDKIIDLTIKELYKKAHISTRCYLQTSVNACMKHKNCYECLKQYFENKVKQKSEQK